MGDMNSHDIHIIRVDVDCQVFSRENTLDSQAFCIGWGGVSVPENGSCTGTVIFLSSVTTERLPAL